MAKTHVYRLLEKTGKIVYIGMSNNPDKRSLDHKRDGKNFHSVQIVSSHLSRQAAKKAEGELVTQYIKRTGRRPKYNQTNLGDKLK